MIDENEYLLVDWTDIRTKESKKTNNLWLLQCPVCEDWYQELCCIGRGKLCCKKCQRDRKLEIDIN